MTREDFEQWLRRYGEAWTAGDPEAVIALFAADAAYFETPFEPPMVGHAAIRRYWTEGAKNAQTGVRFAATVVAFDGTAGCARWQASFRRVPSGVSVELDGVLQAWFDVGQRCREFREWWHRREC